MACYIAKRPFFVNTFSPFFEEKLPCSRVSQLFVSAGVIKARKQPLELFCTDGDYFFPGSGPSESVLLKTLMPDAKSVMIPVKDLDHVPPPIAENKQISRKWVLLQDLFDHNGKTVNGLSHIGTSHCQENSVGLDGKHHIAAISRIRCDMDDSGASASNSIVKPFGVKTRITGALCDLSLNDGSFKGTRVSPVSVSRQRRRQ